MEQKPTWMAKARADEVERLETIRQTRDSWQAFLNTEGKKLRDRCYARARRDAERQGK